MHRGGQEQGVQDTLALWPTEYKATEVRRANRIRPALTRRGSGRPAKGFRQSLGWRLEY
ncbi:hypothetical protein MPL3365_70253 [Mesorhizobium plurifarium]|uniref:Uncharacterized protein n=1 Tax=Mesorhizobium plurifarium TaxID=69974 RepID=A0A090GW17_MESPL|nr:hypothetical protein MPL3365_70253 [Mesorhizobium plurifarium]